ncbi:hypothetical protein J6590_092999, partial [Homalodisca vitripennis]
YAHGFSVIQQEIESETAGNKFGEIGYINSGVHQGRPLPTLTRAARPTCHHCADDSHSGPAKLIFSIIDI